VKKSEIERFLIRRFDPTLRGFDPTREWAATLLDSFKTERARAFEDLFKLSKLPSGELKKSETHRILNRYFGSADRARAFSDLFKLSKLPSEYFWQLLVENWASFDLIPHNEFEKSFRKYRRAWRADHMKADDLAFYKPLPKAFTVYRGQNEGARVGLSWTLDEGVAKTFARGHRGIVNAAPIVIVAEIDKRDVAFACTDRHEAEVVIFSASFARLHA
jgi:hypothetical protein